MSWTAYSFFRMIKLKPAVGALFIEDEFGVSIEQRLFLHSSQTHSQAKLIVMDVAASMLKVNSLKWVRTLIYSSDLKNLRQLPQRLKRKDLFWMRLLQLKTSLTNPVF